MKIGLVGAGFMSRTHLAGWRAIGEQVTGLLGFGDPTVDALAREEELEVFADLPALAAACDVVDVCSPTYTHREYVLSAVAAGTPVFCEKPLALDLEHAAEMVGAAAAADVPFGVGHVLRYFPEYASAAARARAGELGDLAVLRFSRCTFAPKTAWYLDDARSGGVILDLMIHDLDFARYVAGDVSRVYAVVDRTGSGPHAYILLTHQSGTITHVEGSWRMPQPEFLTSFEIAGSRALLTFDSTQSGAVVPHITPPATVEGERNVPVGPDVPVAASPVSEDPYASQLKAFRDAISAGKAPPVDGSEGLRALQIALAAVESSRTGQPVDITPSEVE